MKNGSKVLAAALTCMALLTPVAAMAATTGAVAVPEPSLINEQAWNVSDITAIEATYATDRVAVLPSTNDKIVLKEYLTEHNASYHATTEVNGSTLNIHLGARPSVSYVSRIEIYVPDIMSGTVNVNTTSGKIEINRYNGALDATASSGKIEVIDSAIRGYLSTTSGAIEASLTGLTGDLAATASSGSVTANIAASIDFKINAGSDTGKVANNFSDTFDTSSKSVTGAWGSNPANTITLRSSSSTVTINAK